RLATCATGEATGRVPPGRIHTQTPEEVGRVPGRQQVRALVEPAPPQPRVPSVINQSCSEAARELEGGKLRLATCATGEATGRVPAGRIREETPEAGAPIPGDRQVRALVEPAPPQPRVPSVINQSCSEAARELEGGKLRLATCATGEATGRVPPGRIHTQTPE